MRSHESAHLKRKYRDMKSIKERARELWGNLPIIQEDYIADIEKALEEQKAIDEDAFHAVVEEQVLKAIEKQRAIDIDKACEWLKSNRHSIFINDEPCQFGGSAELDDDFIVEFRKAMEE